MALILLFLTNCYVFNCVDNSILYTRYDKYFNTTAGNANRTFGFVMRDMGTITGAGNGLQGSGMADISLNGSFFYKANLEFLNWLI